MTHPLLARARVASPCSADWTAMRGDDRTRYCDACALRVHDLSAYTADEAEAFLEGATTTRNGRICVRLWRRTDGTVLTRDCPEGVRDAARQARRRWAEKGAVIATLAGLWAASLYVADQTWALVHPAPWAPSGDEMLLGDFDPPPPPSGGEVLMEDLPPPFAGELVIE